MLYFSDLVEQLTNEWPVHEKCGVVSTTRNWWQKPTMPTCKDVVDCWKKRNINWTGTAIAGTGDDNDNDNDNDGDGDGDGDDLN